MSRAFVKETDGDEVGSDLPERPQSPHTNYVTPRGLEELQAKVREFGAQWDALAGRDDFAGQQLRKRVERELQYYNERIRRAVPVSPAMQPDERVHFGATVEVEDPDGNRLRFTIVGEDEADAGQGKISWVSPLARALLNAEVGDVVNWKRPAGDLEVGIMAIGKG